MRLIETAKWIVPTIFHLSPFGAAISVALDDVCKALNILNGIPAREVIAQRIITLHWRGERSPTLLRDRVVQ